MLRPVSDKVTRLSAPGARRGNNRRFTFMGSIVLTDDELEEAEWDVRQAIQNQIGPVGVELVSLITVEDA